MRGFFRFTARQLLLLLLAAGMLLAVLAPRLRHGYGERWQQHLNDQLLKAAAAGDERGVANALEAGADISAWDERKGTALSYAIGHGNLKLIDRVLAAGADPNMEFPSNNALPLSSAAVLDNPAIARRLLAAGADLQRSNAVRSCVTSNRQETLQVLFEHGAKPPNVVFAIESSLPRDEKLSMVRFLLEHGAAADAAGTSNPIFAPTLPMGFALREGDGELGDLLCEFGAPYTAREAAVFGRLKDVRRMVEENPDLVRQRFPPYYHVYKPELNPTLLGLALRHARRDVALYLIDAGAPLDVREWDNETLMHQAAAGGDAVLIRTLAERGLSVNDPSDWDRPLWRAVRGGHVAAVAALIELGADMAEPGPLHSAASQSHPQLVRMLLAAGADPSQLDRQGKTPLDIARMKGHAAVISILEDFATAANAD